MVSSPLISTSTWPKFKSMDRKEKHAERLKSRERRPEVNRLDGQWAQWSIGSMVDRLNGQMAQWLISLMVDRLHGP